MWNLHVSETDLSISWYKKGRPDTQIEAVAVLLRWLQCFFFTGFQFKIRQDLQLWLVSFTLPLCMQLKKYTRI